MNMWFGIRQPTTWTSRIYSDKLCRSVLTSYANNHYAGHAPATIELFRELWYVCERSAGTGARAKIRRESSLFGALKE